MRTRFFSLFDYVMFFSALIIMVCSVLFIYSSGINSQGVNVSREYIKQIIWASTGIVLLIVVSFLDYRKIKRFTLWVYLGLLVVLIFTRFLVVL